MREVINRFGQRRRVTQAKRQQRTASRRLGIARQATAIALVALLVLSSLTGLVQAADGDLDPTFDSDGKVTTDAFGIGSFANALAIQADGRIVVAGIAFSSMTEGDFGLARYNSDGSLDNTFGTGGLVTTDFFGGTSNAAAIAIQGDGQIVVAGYAQLTAGEQDFALARYHTDGSLDATFGAGGLVTSDVGHNDSLTSLAIQPDGKLVAVGFAGSGSTFDDFAVLRYNADGSLDSTFGSGGVVITDFSGFGDVASAVVIQGDGHIVAAGSTEPSILSNGDFALARYNADGSLDATFGAGGKVITDFLGGSDDDASDLAIQEDGRLVAAGSTSVNSTNTDQYNFALARYNADGFPDISFGSGGKVITDFLGQNDFASGLAIQADGRLVAAGKATVAGAPISDFALARFNTNGSLDNSFGAGGKVTTDFFNNNDRAADVAIQSDGRILAAGLASKSTNSGLQASFAVARYLGSAVAAYNACLQDDETGDTLQFNSRTGDYRFSRCGARGFTLSGRGAMRIAGCDISLTDSTREHAVTATLDTCKSKGTASIVVYSPPESFRINDEETSDNPCSCR